MYKKIIAYALVCMSYHGTYVAIDFYDDSSSRGPYESHMILQSFNDTDASCVFGHSNTADPFNQGTNLNEAYRNTATQKATAAPDIAPSLAQLAHSNRFIKSLYDCN